MHKQELNLKLIPDWIDNLILLAIILLLVTHLGPFNF